MLAEKYILLDSLLFKIITTPDKETTVLAIPERYRSNYYLISCKSICGTSMHNKTCLTINDKFFIPNLIHYLRSYITGCHICQLMHNEKPPT